MMKFDSDMNYLFLFHFSRVIFQNYYIGKITIILIYCFSVFNTAFALNSFVVGELTGQLGNQMFVIAATVSLALDHDSDPIFPDLVNKTVDNIPLNYQKVFYHLNPFMPQNKHISVRYKEPHYHYAPIPYSPNMCIAGYFQSEKYFQHHKKEIIELFKPHPEITEYLQKKYGDLLNCPNTVSVHMRSYLDFDPAQRIYPFYGKCYFEKAMSLFPADTLFIVFSNDMNLCKKELADIPRNMYFVEGEEHYHDLYLMSMCKHNIICHSSFSWWAAYLNPNPHKIIITPPVWFNDSAGLNSKDVVPADWIILKY